jgi:hypothetical protein
MHSFKKYFVLAIVLISFMIVCIGCQVSKGPYPLTHQYDINADFMTATVDSFEPMLGTNSADYLTMGTSNTTMINMDVEPIGFHVDELYIPASILHITEVTMTEVDSGEVMHVWAGMTTGEAAGYLSLVGSTATYKDVHVLAVGLDMSGSKANGSGMVIDLCGRNNIDSPDDTGGQNILWHEADNGYEREGTLIGPVKSCSVDSASCPPGGGSNADHPWYCELDAQSYPIANYTNPAYDNSVELGSQGKGVAVWNDVVEYVNATREVDGDTYSGRWQMTSTSMQFNAPTQFVLYYTGFTGYQPPNEPPNTPTLDIHKFGWERQTYVDYKYINIYDAQFGVYILTAETFTFDNYVMTSPLSD